MMSIGGRPSNPEQVRDAMERAPWVADIYQPAEDYSGLSDLKAVACAEASKDGEALPAAWRGWTASGQTVPGETSVLRSRRNPNEHLDSQSEGCCECQGFVSRPARTLVREARAGSKAARNTLSR